MSRPISPDPKRRYLDGHNRPIGSHTSLVDERGLVVGVLNRSQAPILHRPCISCKAYTCAACPTVLNCVYEIATTQTRAQTMKTRDGREIQATYDGNTMGYYVQEYAGSRYSKRIWTESAGFAPEHYDACVRELAENDGQIPQSWRTR